MELIEEKFLKTCGFESFNLVQMPQDASSKSYSRVFIDRPDSSLILMHYPEGEDEFDKFIQVSKTLRACGLIAPEIVGYDLQNKLILLQDFGDLSLKKYLQKPCTDQTLVYKNLVDLMLKMQKVCSLSLGRHAKSYTKQTLLAELNIVVNWYFPYIGVKNNQELSKRYLSLWQEALELLPEGLDVFVHRDFHVDNLFVVGGSIGVLDFQDCLFGSPVYDLASLLDDARFDVPSDLRDEMIDYYAKTVKADLSQITTIYHLLAAQRNSRILGVFARKAMKGDDKYVAFMPRVIAYLNSNLMIPELKAISQWMTFNNILSV